MLRSHWAICSSLYLLCISQPLYIISALISGRPSLCLISINILHWASQRIHNLEIPWFLIDRYSKILFPLPPLTSSCLVPRVGRILMIWDSVLPWSHSTTPTSYNSTWFYSQESVPCSPFMVHQMPVSQPCVWVPAGCPPRFTGSSTNRTALLLAKPTLLLKTFFPENPPPEWQSDGWCLVLCWQIFRCSLPAWISNYNLHLLVPLTTYWDTSSPHVRPF